MALTLTGSIVTCKAFVNNESKVFDFISLKFTFLGTRIEVVSG
jgi:hypothetical protein